MLRWRALVREAGTRREARTPYLTARVDWLPQFLAYRQISDERPHEHGPSAVEDRLVSEDVECRFGRVILAIEVPVVDASVACEVNHD